MAAMTMLAIAVSMAGVLSLSRASPRAGNPGLSVTATSSGQYSLAVNDQVWLTNGNTFFRANGKEYSVADRSLELVNTSSASGDDKLGQWETTDFCYKAGDTYIRASIKTYDNPPLPLAIFYQKYLTPAENTSSGKTDDVVSSFPSFLVGGQRVDLGYLSFAGDMAGYSQMKNGSWSKGASFESGIWGGPIILFDNSSNAMVISPFSQFMAASNQLDTGNNQVYYGIMGEVNSVPSQYEQAYIVYYSGRGINAAMSNWGDILTTWYGKTTEGRDSDLTLNYMGYWTDNGAYYYYLTEPKKNYEETIIDIATYARQNQLPFKYVQFDSFWYPKGPTQGTMTWTPVNTSFPHGFKYLYQKTGLPIVCHNRFWDGKTPYAKYNGGRWNFILDEKSTYALPDDQGFWNYLLQQAQGWGKFLVYEQDWLNTETGHMHVLTSDLDIGRRWLTQMGAAARTVGATVQYCMAQSRHILQSLEIPAVTQARASHDYHPGIRQWNIGITSMVLDAVHLAPFKDNFWTTSEQPGNKYHGYEKYTTLNHLVATLSAGAVGPSDKIGYVNRTLLMKCCDSDGKILKPNVPAKAIDDQLKKMVFPDYDGPDGQVWTTHSNVSGYWFGVVMATEMTNDYLLTPSAGWSYYLPGRVYGSGNRSSNLPVEFSNSQPLRLGSECSLLHPCVYYTSPELLITSINVPVLLLGEPEKWVPMSSRRFPSLELAHEDVYVRVNVGSNETVTFQYMYDDMTQVQTVTCDNSGRPKPTSGVISVRYGKCQLG